MKYNHITNCTEFEVSSDYGVAPDTIMNNNIWCPESVNYLNCPDSSLGILVTVNDNGDSCDIYGNISMDPFFESGTPYSYYLQSSSPCIDAGMDLGFPYYGNAPDIGALESNFMGVDDFTDNIPTKFFLGDNYPNPFNQTTTIKFDLARTAKVNLSITNILGEEVRELCSDFLSPGSYVFQWDSQNASSGIYFIIFNADNYKKIVKCVCIK
jgi:hypothetical protein